MVLMWAAKVVAAVNAAERTENMVTPDRGMQLIYIKNQTGPRIDPCGTPVLSIDVYGIGGVER